MRNTPSQSSASPNTQADSLNHAPAIQELMDKRLLQLEQQWRLLYGAADQQSTQAQKEKTPRSD